MNKFVLSAIDELAQKREALRNRGEELQGELALIAAQIGQLTLNGGSGVEALHAKFAEKSAQSAAIGLALQELERGEIAAQAADTIAAAENAIAELKASAAIEKQLQDLLHFYSVASNVLAGDTNRTHATTRHWSDKARAKLNKAAELQPDNPRIAELWQEFEQHNYTPDMLYFNSPEYRIYVRNEVDKLLKGGKK